MSNTTTTINLETRFQRLKAFAQAGYTLVELAIVMGIVGIFLASGLRALHIYNQHQAYKHDKLAMTSITTALTGFLSSNGRYPCPARFDESRADATYGMETDCTDTSVAIGDCSDGICVEESVRVVPGLGTRVRVRRGAVPFRNLNIFEEDSYDGNGYKFSYIVTEILADDTTFDAIHGGISIVDTAGVTVVDPASSAHFAIISHGTDGKGAYTHAGIQVRACTGGDVDVENCNTTDDSDAVYLSSLKTKATANYYDDSITYRTASERPLWRVTNASNFNITDLADAGGGIGGGAKPSAPVGDPDAAKLDVSGDMRASGDVRLIEICDENDDACFPTDLIAGGTGMGCPPLEFATGVSNSSLDCETAVENSCPAGEYMIGIDADRRPICDEPPSTCSPRTVTVCGGSPGAVTYNLPSQISGTYSSPNPLTGGTSRNERWRCRSYGWTRTSSWGSCTCSPDTWTRTYGCPSGFEGSRTVEYTRSCPSGNVSSTETFNSCACAPRTSTQSRECPADGFSGTQTRTREWTCSDPNNGSWGGWTPWDGTCTCNPDQRQRTLSCPAGYSGTGDYQENDFQCPAGTWTGWNTVTPGNCTCTIQTETRTLDCPAGYAGGIEEQRTSTCPGGGWGPWTPTAGGNTCTEITCSWNPATSNSSISGTGIGKKVGTDCSCGSSNQSCWESLGVGSYKNYPSCACISNF